MADQFYDMLNNFKQYAYSHVQLVKPQITKAQWTLHVT